MGKAVVRYFSITALGMVGPGLSIRQGVPAAVVLKQTATALLQRCPPTNDSHFWNPRAGISGILFRTGTRRRRVDDVFSVIPTTTRVQNKRVAFGVRLRRFIASERTWYIANRCSISKERSCTCTRAPVIRRHAAVSYGCHFRAKLSIQQRLSMWRPFPRALESLFWSAT